MSNIQFQGIVAVGNTRAQAINRYRMLTMGKGATCFVDRNNTKAFVSNAAADLENIFNPENGNMDLVQSDEALNDLSFEARAGDVHEAFHYQCTAGCGSHLLFDSDAFVQHCPVCASAVASSDDDSEDADDDLSDEELDDLDVDDELEDEEIADDESDDESDEGEESTDSEATAADDDESEEEEIDDSDDTEEDEGDTDEEEDDESSDDEGDDDSDSDQDEEDDMADAPLVVAAGSRDEAIREYSRIQSKKLVATASDVQTVNYMVCASAEGCGAHIVSGAELDKCPRPECGKGLVEPATANDEVDPAQDALDLDADDADASSDADTDSAEGETDKSEKTEGDTDTSMSVIDGSAEASDDESDDSEEAGDDESEEDDSEEDDSEEDEAADEDMDKIEVDLMDDIPDDASVDELDVSYSAAVNGSPAWTAYFRGRPVAVATHQSIQKDHKDLFDTARFGHAAIAASKIGGVSKVLRELGFNGIKASVSVPKRIETRAVALASEQMEHLEQQRDEYTQRLEAALATAGIGISRGFFQGQSNPVRDSLNAALASCGVRNPEIIVDNALRASFEVFLSSMFERARDILSKPVEVQESLSKTILDMTYMPNGGVATASSAGNLESRLSSFGTAVASADNKGSKPETAVAAAASDDFSARLNQVVGSLGRR